MILVLWLQMLVNMNWIISPRTYHSNLYLSVNKNLAHVFSKNVSRALWPRYSYFHFTDEEKDAQSIEDHIGSKNTDFCPGVLIYAIVFHPFITSAHGIHKGHCTHYDTALKTILHVSYPAQGLTLTDENSRVCDWMWMSPPPSWPHLGHNLLDAWDQLFYVLCNSVLGT